MIHISVENPHFNEINDVNKDKKQNPFFKVNENLIPTEN